MTNIYRKNYNDIRHNVNVEENVDILKDAACDGKPEAQYYLAKYFLYMEHNVLSSNYWLVESAQANYFPAVKTACKLLGDKPQYTVKAIAWRKFLAEKSKERKTRCEKPVSEIKDYLNINDSVIYNKEDKERIINILKQEVHKGNLDKACEIIRKAAMGDVLAHSILADKKMGYSMNAAYQNIFWKKHMDAPMKEYISRMYPRYNILMEIMSHFERDGLNGNYDADVEQLTDIRGVAGLEILQYLADKGVEPAMEAVLRINYQNTHFNNTWQYIEYMGKKESKTAKMYVLLALYVAKTDFHKTLAYLQEGYVKYGQEMLDFLQKFVVKGIPAVKAYVAMAYASSSIGFHDVSVARHILEKLRNRHKKEADIVEGFILNNALCAA